MKLAEQIKQAIDALAFADAGEPLGPRAMYAALNPDYATPPPRPEPHMGRKLVALGVGASLPAEVMTYIVGTCRRMQADLLLITEDATRVRALLAPYLSELEGIQCLAEEVPSASRRAVVRVLQQNSNILFAVTGSPDDPVHALLKAKRGLLEPKTPVPVVMVGKEPVKAKTNPATLPRLAAG
jgi:hypothetical protein